MVSSSTLLVTLWLSVASSTEPTVQQLADHKVSGTVIVAAPLERVQSVLSDPRYIAKIDDNGTVVTILGNKAACQSIRTTVDNPIASISYDAEVCPIAGGWRTRLVQSDDLQAFESTWKLSAAEDGKTTVQYDVRTIPDIPVPQFVVDRATRSSVHSMLVKLRKHLEDG